ncbi:MAG: hypothetical protein JNK84_06700 [Phreatobacter sp.]|uniref:hypothetical protein n=1 Tax=Phreatobacter sp. TaxID=1966341 RepID=UPI001A4F900E|nr:hypothetical protein [Phreatobacter sp.]MBL8568759.1 hypothetical protein [Phreatobacter sp.]
MSPPHPPLPPRLPQVQRLIGLSRSNGVDVRPTLLRVVVDQFVAEPHHGAAEVTRFGELVLHLLDRADESERAIVAAKLAPHPQTPTALARRLAADVPAVACPVLAQSPALSDDDQFLAVRSGDAEKAAAVASRADLGLAALVALEDFDDASVAAALAARVPVQPIAMRRTIGDGPRDLGSAFLGGTAAQRETLIAELVLRPLSIAAETPSDPKRAVELSALSRRTGALAAALVNVLGLAPDTAGRIAGDESGETLIVVARALDLGREAAARILLFAHEAVGTSVARVYDLTALYDALPRPAALTILQSWQAASEALPAPVRTARHASVLAQDASDRIGARQAANPAGRTVARPTAQPGGIRRPNGG